MTAREDYHTNLLVVQPTPFCNINCSYCYLPDRTNKKQLSFELAEIAFSRLLRFPTIKGQVTIVWHAGEPFVLPVDYYERMFEIVASVTPPGLQVFHSFQTNGTLISNEWCEFIKSHDINIGVSIDGPEEFHDLYRKQRNGLGSFARAIQGLKLLQDHGISHHVISVLTLESMQHPDKMLKFYIDNSIKSVAFNIEEQEGSFISPVVSESNAHLLYKSFLEQFLELLIGSGEDICVREVETSLGMVRNYTGQAIYNHQVIPFGIISMDCEGNISTFSPELLGLKNARYDHFCFGNINNDDYREIKRRVEESVLFRDIQLGVQRCRDVCDYYAVCGGGAPVNKIYENGSAASVETVYCRTHQVGIDVVLNLIERLPKNLKPRDAFSDQYIR